MIRSFYKRYPAVVAFGLILLTFLAYLPTTTYNYLPYDSGGYWKNGALYLQDGKFALTNYNHDFRGYLLPLLYLPFYLFWQASGIELFAIVKILGAFTAAFFFGAVIPWLWKTWFPGAKTGLGSRLLLGLLGFIFWRDYFSFTLSDFPALLVFSVCLALLYDRAVWWKVILAGFLYGAVINFRPTYLICAPLLVLAILFLNNSRAHLKNAFLLLFFIAGFFLVSLPQMLINARHHNSFSPLVVVKYGNQDKSLYLQQLEWGIQIQRFETNLDPDYPSPQLIFIDPAGQKFAQMEALNMELVADPETGEVDITHFAPGSGFKDFGQYFSAVFSNPVRFSGIYLRHLFNGLDLQFPSPYIQDVFKVHYGMIFLNYVVLFLALFTFCFRLLPGLKLRQGAFLLIFLAPALLAIPTAIECRYALPFHIFAYGLVVFMAPWHWWHEAKSRQKVIFIAGFIVFVSACFLLSSQVQQTLMLQPRHLF